MDELWIRQMGVDNSPGGRNQPFYNVVGDDGSRRYAAHSKSFALFATLETKRNLSGVDFRKDLWDC